MLNKYNSQFYSKPIEVENIDWEILVNIITDSWEKIIYSWYDIIEKRSYSTYISKCLLWGFINSIPEKVLIIWFWWWAFAKYLEDYISWINITWIEIDEAMLKIAKEEMLVKTSNFFIMDAFEAINILKNKKKNKYDLILLDVYWANWKIPDYFTKKDFFIVIKELLWLNGILSINYADYRDENKKIYDKIHNNLLNIFWDNYIHILSWKEEDWNISWIYNLNKKYSSEEVVLKYLEKVQNSEINYDSNLIKNINIR